MAEFLTKLAESLPIGQAIIVLILAWICMGISEVRAEVKEMHHGMSSFTKDIGVMKEWQRGHERLDEERHQAIASQHHEILRQLEGLRAKGLG